MLAYAPWQSLVTYIFLCYVVYGILAVLALVFGFLNWPYVNCFVLLAMLAVYLISIPLNLNFTRRNYKVLFLWFVGHILFAVMLYAWHYSKSGIVGRDGELSHLFRDSLYFSITTWTTLGYGDFAPVPSMRLITSVQALSGLFTIPVGFSLVWFMIQESTVPYTQAYLDKNDYDETGHLKESRPDYKQKEKPNKPSGGDVQ